MPETLEWELYLGDMGEREVIVSYDYTPEGSASEFDPGVSEYVDILDVTLKCNGWSIHGLLTEECCNALGDQCREDALRAIKRAKDEAAEERACATESYWEERRYLNAA